MISYSSRRTLRFTCSLASLTVLTSDVITKVLVGSSQRRGTSIVVLQSTNFGTFVHYRQPYTTFKNKSIAMAAAGKYQLLCLENPLLDISATGYVFPLLVVPVVLPHRPVNAHIQEPFTYPTLS